MICSPCQWLISLSMFREHYCCLEKPTTLCWCLVEAPKTWTLVPLSLTLASHRSGPSTLAICLMGDLTTTHPRVDGWAGV